MVFYMLSTELKKCPKCENNTLRTIEDEDCNTCMNIECEFNNCGVL